MCEYRLYPALFPLPCHPFAVFAPLRDTSWFEAGKKLHAKAQRR